MVIPQTMDGNLKRRFSRTPTDVWASQDEGGEEDDDDVAG